MIKGIFNNYPSVNTTSEQRRRPSMTRGEFSLFSGTKITGGEMTTSSHKLTTLFYPLYSCLSFFITGLLIMPEQSTQTLKAVVPGSPLTPNFNAKDYSIFFLAGALCCTM